MDYPPWSHPQKMVWNYYAPGTYCLSKNRRTNLPLLSWTLRKTGSLCPTNAATKNTYISHLHLTANAATTLWHIGAQKPTNLSPVIMPSTTANGSPLGSSFLYYHCNVFFFTLYVQFFYYICSTSIRSNLQAANCFLPIDTPPSIYTTWTFPLVCPSMNLKLQSSHMRYCFILLLHIHGS